MSYKFNCGYPLRLVVIISSFLRLKKWSLKQKLSHYRKFRIGNRHRRCKRICETWRTPIGISCTKRQNRLLPGIGLCWKSSGIISLTLEALTLSTRSLVCITNLGITFLLRTFTSHYRFKNPNLLNSHHSKI